MAFDVTGLSAYVQNNSKRYAIEAISGAPTAKLLIDSENFQTGVKGESAILKMAHDVAPKVNDGCGRVAGGKVKLSDSKIKVVPLADYTNVCPKDLWGKLSSTALLKGQNPEEGFTPEFAEQVMTSRAQKIAEHNEVLMWQGNTTLTGSTTINTIDGFLVQLPSGQTLTVSGSTMVEKMQDFYQKTPTKVRNKSDYYIFVGEDSFDSYAIALANKNIYKPVEDSTLFGTKAKIVATSGLNGTNFIVGGRLSDMHLGMDGEGDADTATMEYSNETKQWYLDFAYGLGVKIVHTNQVFKASVA